MPSDDTCPKCFHPIKESAQVCENCGARTRSQASSPSQTRIVVAEGNPFMTIISACLFLYVGFFMSWGPPPEHPIFDASVPVWIWGTRSIGIGLLAVAALAYLRVPFVIILDAVISIAAALICLAVGAIWLYFGYHQEGFLIFIFGLFNSRAAIHAAKQLARMTSGGGGAG